MIIERLKWRYAVQKFKTDKLPQEKVEKLLNAALLTPSSFGLQPWRFVVVENTEVRQELLKYSWNQQQVVDASHLLVLCRQADVSETDVDRYINSIAFRRNVTIDSLEGFRLSMHKFIARLNDVQKEHWLTKQVYIALGVLLTACALEHIDACPIEGFVSGEFDKILGLEEKGLRSLVLVPIGYRDDNDKLAKLEKVRFDLHEMVIRV